MLALVVKVLLSTGLVDEGGVPRRGADSRKGRKHVMLFKGPRLDSRKNSPPREQTVDEANACYTLALNHCCKYIAESRCFCMLPVSVSSVLGSKTQKTVSHQVAGENYNKSYSYSYEVPGVGRNNMMQRQYTLRWTAYRYRTWHIIFQGASHTANPGTTALVYEIPSLASLCSLRELDLSGANRVARRRSYGCYPVLRRK